MLGVAAGVDLEGIRYGRMRWNTPLSEEHAGLLLAQLGIGPGASVLDLGCGWAELLLRAVAAGGKAGCEPVTGIGVDTDGEALDRGRKLASDSGLQSQITLINQPAAAWTEPADRILCVGASHALGGAEKALAVLMERTAPGGRVLFGEGCWERPPTELASALFDDVLPLADLVAVAVTAGWRVLHLSCADQREWDEFESMWRLGRQEWLLAHPDHEQAAAVRDQLDAQLKEYVSVYRGVLGFCYLILAR